MAETIKLKPADENFKKNIVLKDLFGDKDSLTKKELEDLTRTYYNPDLIKKPEYIKIYNHFTWADLLRAFDGKESVTKEEIDKLLDKYKV